MSKQTFEEIDFEEQSRLYAFLAKAFPPVVVLVNAFFTALFGFNFLTTLTEFPTPFLNGLVGGVVSVLLLDVAGFAWKSLRQSTGITEMQMNTADVMSKATIGGSILASVIVSFLVTNIVVMDEQYIATFEWLAVGLITVAISANFLAFVIYNFSAPEMKKQASRVKIAALNLDSKLKQSEKIQRIAMHQKEKALTNMFHEVAQQNANKQFLIGLQQEGFVGNVEGLDGNMYQVGSQIAEVVETVNVTPASPDIMAAESPAPDAYIVKPASLEQIYLYIRICVDLDTQPTLEGFKEAYPNYMLTQQELDEACTDFYLKNAGIPQQQEQSTPLT